MAQPYDAQKPRARQNVILELGYFLGRLGRNRVCALYRSGVEIPSDYAGVLFTELDEGGGWRLQLAKELKAAGLPVDMNNAL
jgi:predicted nucleotide-binding protein